jgi:recombination protein RecA
MPIERKKKKENRAINSAIAALDKRFGESVVRKMSEVNKAKTFSTGRADLDLVLGGGYGVGKVIEIYAESGCGKTGLALEAAESIQSSGGVVAMIDAEHALNTEYCEQIGVSIDDMYISQPSYGEQAFEAIRALINTGEVDLIIVDSVSALVPKAELEGESGEAKIALQARLMSQGMKLISGPASANDCTVIFINQLRSTIAMYGPSLTTTGGKALKFYASQRLEVKNKGIIKEGEDVIGFKQHIKVVKNKIGIPFKTLDNDIIYGQGVDKITGLVEALVFEEILTKTGSWFSYNDVKIANGIKKLRIFFNENPDVLEELEMTLKHKRDA